MKEHHEDELPVLVTTRLQLETFELNDPQSSDGRQPYPSNAVSSTKYTIWSFLPLTILFQLTKFANLFYIVNAVLQSIPAVSTNNPLVTYVLLLYVVVLGILKEAFTEYGRMKQDSKENGKMATRVVYEDGAEQVVSVRRDQICVGDILRVKDGEEFPADCLILTKHYREDEDDDDDREEKDLQVFTKTVSLDGETNLKPKNLIPRVHETIYNDENAVLAVKMLELARFAVHGSKPDTDLYTFEGKLQFGQEEQIDLDISHFLHRGSTLSNSNMVDCLVLYTGTNTKLVLNQGNYANFKLTRLEQFFNKIVIYQTVSIVVLSVLFTMLNFWFISQNGSWEYLFFEADRGDLVFKSFWSFYLVLNRFVPFELVIIIEMCKIHYSLWILNDVILINEETGEGPMVHNLTSLEDCGEIKYLFCDKTGTLT